MYFIFPRCSSDYVTKAKGPGEAWVRRLAPKMRRKLQVPLRNALALIKDKVELGRLERAVAAENADRVVELSLVDRVGSIVGSFGEILEDPLLEGANVAIKELGKRGLALDMFRPRLERWIERHTGQLVKQVNGTSRKAVRSVLKDGIRRGRHPRNLAKDVRRIVGLTEPQAIAVARYQQAMVDAGVPDAAIEQRATRYAEGLLRQRAEVITRTETMTAINGGRHELWMQLEADGELEPGDQRQWLTSEDERVCPICGPMNEQVTTIGGQYLTPTGVTLDHPPAHPACRCTEVLV